MVNDTKVIELPSIGKTEQRVNIKTRIYYNLIPDMVMHVLQRTQLEQVFLRSSFIFSSPAWKRYMSTLKMHISGMYLRRKNNVSSSL